MSDYTVTVLNPDGGTIAEFETDAFEVEDGVIANTDDIVSPTINEQATASAVSVSGSGVDTTLSLAGSTTVAAGGRFGVIEGQLLGAVDDDSDEACLSCPGCGSDTARLHELGRVGMQDQFGVECGDCGAELAKVSMVEIADDVTLPSMQS